MTIVVVNCGETLACFCLPKRQHTTTILLKFCIPLSYSSFAYETIISKHKSSIIKKNQEKKLLQVSIYIKLGKFNILAGNVANNNNNYKLLNVHSSTYFSLSLYFMKQFCVAANCGIGICYVSFQCFLLVCLEVTIVQNFLTQILYWLAKQKVTKKAKK